jgi:hypothetical protein
MTSVRQTGEAQIEGLPSSRVAGCGYRDSCRSSDWGSWPEPSGLSRPTVGGGVAGWDEDPLHETCVKKFIQQ